MLRGCYKQTIFQNNLNGRFPGSQRLDELVGLHLKILGVKFELKTSTLRHVFFGFITNMKIDETFYN